MSTNVTGEVWELVEPNVRFHAAFLKAVAEFASNDDFPHGSLVAAEGQAPGPTVWTAAELADPAQFGAFVEHQLRLVDPVYVAPLGLVTDTQRWMMAGPTLVGFLSLRHDLNDYLRNVGGHIGFSVRPSYRRRGIATWALRQALQMAAELGIDRTLVTCDTTNLASAATIRRCGGVLFDPLKANPTGLE